VYFWRRLWKAGDGSCDVSAGGRCAVCRQSSPGLTCTSWQTGTDYHRTTVAASPTTSTTGDRNTPHIMLTTLVRSTHEHDEENVPSLVSILAISSQSLIRPAYLARRYCDSSRLLVSVRVCSLTSVGAEPNTSKTVGDRDSIGYSGALIGNCIWRIEWSRARCRPPVRGQVTSSDDVTWLLSGGRRCTRLRFRFVSATLWNVLPCDTKRYGNNDFNMRPTTKE